MDRKRFATAPPPPQTADTQCQYDYEFIVINNTRDLVACPDGFREMRMLLIFNDTPPYFIVLSLMQERQPDLTMRYTNWARTTPNFFERTEIPPEMSKFNKGQTRKKAG